MAEGLPTFTDMISQLKLAREKRILLVVGPPRRMKLGPSKTDIAFWSFLVIGVTPL